MTYNRTTTYVPKKTNHVLHLILSAVTCGAWLPVWACVALWNALAKDKHTTVSQGTQPVYMPYAVGPGAPVSAMNPHPPVQAVPMPQNAPYVGYSGPPTGMTRKPWPEATGTEWHLGPGYPVCSHGKGFNDKCEDCARPASFPQ